MAEMLPEERDQLLVLMDGEARWCRHAEAHDAQGHAVQYDDPGAVAWDFTGALCRLFGWRRACVLFEQIDRHIHGKRFSFGWPEKDPAIEAMVALQLFNDEFGTTLGAIRDQIESMPMWKGTARANDPI